MDNSIFFHILKLKKSTLQTQIIGFDKPKIHVETFRNE